MPTFPWDLSLGHFRVALSFGDLLMRIFRVHAWKLSFGNFRLGSFDLKRSFGNFRFGTAASFRFVFFLGGGGTLAAEPGNCRAITFAWELELGNLRLGTFAWRLSFENLSLLNLRLEL